jgi:hypothetical protein
VLGSKYEFEFRANMKQQKSKSSNQQIHLRNVIMSSNSAQEGSCPSKPNPLKGSNSTQGGSEYLPEDNTAAMTAVDEAEAKMGRQLETEEQEFIKHQLEQHTIIRVKCNLRSEREKERLKVLQIKIRDARTRKYNSPHLQIQKMPAKPGIQRTRKWRGQQREEGVDEQVTNELRVKTVGAAAAVYGFEEVVAFLLNSREEPETWHTTPT